MEISVLDKSTISACPCFAMSQKPVSAYAKACGMAYFPRMLSKIRLHTVGELPPDYHANLGKGADGFCASFLRVQYDALTQRVLAGGTDDEILEWCFTNGRRLTDEEVLIYNSFMSKRGWRDDETDGFIPEMIQTYGLKDDGKVLTDFDLIEMDEGRWYPDMWRDAWK